MPGARPTTEPGPAVTAVGGRSWPQPALHSGLSKIESASLQSGLSRATVASNPSVHDLFRGVRAGRVRQLSDHEADGHGRSRPESLAAFFPSDVNAVSNERSRPG